MRRPASFPQVTLFPFLSVLLCTMGILAFISITFLLIARQEESQPRKTTVSFQWVGAPAYVKPIFIRCNQKEVTYYDLFQNKDRTLPLDTLLRELQGKEDQIGGYLKKLVLLNEQIKRSFGETEYYPLLLIYPDGILGSELLMAIIEKVDGLNVGLEPMLSHWEVPYQSLTPR